VNKHITIYCNIGLFKELFEFQLDIAQKHLDQGDSVDFLVCSGLISICETSRKKCLTNCARCISRRNQGILLLKGKVKKYSIHLFSKKNVKSISIKDTFKNVEDLKSLKIDSFPLGNSVLSSVADIEREHIPCTKKYKSEISDFLHTSKYLYECMNQFIKKKKPDIVYLYNGRHATTRPIVEACKKTKTKFFSYEWCYRSNGYELCEDTIVQDMEYRKKVMNELWNKEDISQNEKERIGTSFYNKKYSAKSIYGKTFKINEDLPVCWSQNNYNITIFTSSEYEDFTVPEYSTSNFYKTQIDGVRKILSADKISKNNKIFFYIRLHPVLGDIKDLPQEIESFIGLEQDYPNCKIIMPRSSISSYALLKHSDKVIHFRSTIGAEAVMIGKPTIMLWKHFMNNSDSFYTPNSHEETISMIIDKNMYPKTKLGVLKYGYFYMKFYSKYKHLEFCSKKNVFFFRGKEVTSSSFVENFLLYNLHRPKLEWLLNRINKFLYSLCRKLVSS
jgi:hypothetical protein